MPPTPTHPRSTRAAAKALKWGGTLVSILLVTLSTFSIWRICIWRDPGVLWDSTGQTDLLAVSGRVGFLRSVGPFAPLRTQVRWIPTRTPQLAWGFDHFEGEGREHYYIPLWPFVAAALAATAAAWRVDGAHRRRARAGACASCGYDRAGLAPASVCPECGTPAATT